MRALMAPALAMALLCVVSATQGPPAQGAPRLDPPLVLWEGGSVAVEAAHLLQPGFLEVEADGALDRAPMVVEVQALLPNALPLHRAYQLRLRGYVLSPEDPSFEVPLEGAWVVVDPRETLHTLRLQWDLKGLESLDPPETAPYVMRLQVEAGTGEAQNPTPVSLSEPYSLEVAVRRAELITHIAPGAGIVASIPLSSPSAAAGLVVDIPPGALDTKEGVHLIIDEAETRPRGVGWVRHGAPVFEIEALGARFLAPITLTLPKAPGKDVKPQIHFFDPEDGTWRPSPTTQLADGRAQTRTDHLSHWTVDITQVELLLELVEGGPGGAPVSCQGGAGTTACEGQGSARVILPMANFEGAALSLLSGLYRRTDTRSETLPSVGDQYHLAGLAPQDNPAPQGSSGLSFEAGLCHATHRSASGVERLRTSRGLGGLGGDAIPLGACFSEVPAGAPPVLHPYADYQNTGALSFGVERLLAPGKVELASLVVPALDDEGTLELGDYRIGELPCSEETRAALAGYLGLDPQTAFSELRDGYSATFLFSCLTLDIRATVGASALTWEDAPSPPPLPVRIPGLSPSEAGATAPLPEGAFAGYALELFRASSETAALEACEARLDPDVTLPLDTHPARVAEDTLLLESRSPGSPSPAEDPLYQTLFETDGLLALSLTDPEGARSCAPLSRYLDADGDGYLRFNAQDGAVIDCDDTNAAIHPDAPEVCDGVDDDCDGEADEGLPLYRPDADQDGYGTDAAGAPTSCAPLLGYALTPGDCQDADADIHPDAPEACDGRDNDCDENIDEGAMTAFYLDADGDGFAPEEAEGIAACAAPSAAFVTDRGDCDDADPTVYTGAPEICDDGLDQDCDGGDVECADLDEDGDGYTQAPGPEFDCDDSDPAVHPGAPTWPVLPLMVADGASSEATSLGCAPAPWPTLDLDFDGQGDAPYIAGPSGSIQGAIEALAEVETYLDAAEARARFQPLRVIALGPGRFEERIWVAGLSLSIVGIPGADGAPPILSAGGSACALADPLHRCSGITLVGGDLTLRGLAIEGGLGTPLSALSGAEGQAVGSIRFGGGILAVEGDLTLEGVSVTGGSAHYGAAIAALGDLPGEGAPHHRLLLRGVEIEGNDITPFPQGAIAGATGALYLEGGEARLMGVRLLDNANPNNGALHYGAAAAAYATALSMVHTTFEGNVGPRAPALVVFEHPEVPGVDLSNVSFLYNVARQDAGAVAVLGESASLPETARIKDALFYFNTTFAGRGGALSLIGSAARIDRSLFSSNFAPQGGALFLGGAGAHTVSGSLLDRNTTPGGVAVGQSVALDSSAGVGLHTLADTILIPHSGAPALPCEGLRFSNSAWWAPEGTAALYCEDALMALVPPEGALTPFVAYAPIAVPTENDFHLLPGARVADRPAPGAPTLPEPTPTPSEGGGEPAPPGGASLIDPRILHVPEGLGLFGEGTGGGLGALSSPCAPSGIWGAWDRAPLSLGGVLRRDAPQSADPAWGPQDALLFEAEAGERVTGSLLSDAILWVEIIGPDQLADGLRALEGEGCEENRFLNAVLTLPGRETPFTVFAQETGPHLVIIHGDGPEDGGHYQLTLE